MGIDEICRLRGLKPVTVYSHISQLIRERKYNDWSRFISVYEIEAVAKVTAAGGNMENPELKPIFEALGEKINYGKIRLALAVLSLNR
ncbi:helix-turn-helix domain-containing protein [Coprobacter sp. LH1063]|uniref:Helix-turn-helix domain-containing protein n=2 Tax=Coprobacter tertius TaxID=2944915 RepID=A0ABT1MEG8_9BACT|nr:helix-turn-helix domain-containing protein [Coprobacter tertius]